MFYKKKGLPEEGDVVLCTVKKILSHSIFVDLDEYVGVEGMIYISEVSPGRIRNIRDFVKEGKKIVCKVLRVKDSNHIDLSLRRVSTTVTINKNKEYKQEIKAEKLLELVGKNLNISLENMYKEVGYKAKEDYGTLTDFYNEILADESLLKTMKINEKIAKELKNMVKEKIKLPSVVITGELILKSYEPNGIEIIKTALSNLDESVKINYLTAPKYKVTIQSENYKKAENILKEVVEKVSKYMKEHNSEFEFNRNA